MNYFYEDPTDEDDRIITNPDDDNDDDDDDDEGGQGDSGGDDGYEDSQSENSNSNNRRRDRNDNKKEDEHRDQQGDQQGEQQGEGQKEKPNNETEPSKQTQDVADQMQGEKNKPTDSQGTENQPKQSDGGPKKPDGPGGDAPSGKPDMPGGKDVAQQGGQKAAEKGGEEVAKKATEEAGKEIAKKGAEQAVVQGGTQAAAGASAGAAAGGAAASGGAAATAATAATPVGWVILIIIAVILLIMIIIGVVFFFLAMPGQIIAKAKELGQKVLDAFTAVVKGEEDVIHTEDMAEVANYLENMGYDLKGEGFVSSDKTESDVKDNQYLDVAQGVVRDNDTGKVTDLNSDPIMTYIVSDNLCYIVKNFNQNLNKATDGNTGEVLSAFGWILALFGTVIAIVFSPITAIVAVVAVAAGSYLAFATASNPNWGTGLISIWHESSMGVRDSAYDVKERGFLELNQETKKMKIKRGWTGAVYTYDVDGWGGQYGMPLEFLLSVHAATQMPDLAMNMATAFDTDVEVLLHKVEAGEIDAGFTADDGKVVTYNEMYEIVTTNNNVFEDVWNWLIGKVEEATGLDTDSADAVTLDAETLEKLHSELGLPHDPSNCSCFDADGNYTSECNACKQYIRDILKAMQEINKDNTGSYTPYISQVKDHWFRDVYFVRQSPSDTEVIGVDEDYFYQTEERWTIYETYSETDDRPEGFEVGDYKLYEYDNGTYTLSTRTRAEVDKLNEELEAGSKDAIRLIKKPASKTLQANYGTIWSAYDIQDYADEEWQELPVNDESPDVIKKFEGKLKYKSRKPGDIAQVEDGERGVTNEKIKNMFVNNLYYQYDGTTTRADEISKDRQKTDREKDNTDDDERNKDLLGRVALGRDSLGAFSMLENTHTLDADYVYKNFKELIVELNYFDKEDLSNKIQEVMQWPIPDCGSAGWPIRKHEKGEDYYGTLINSMVDLELLKNADIEAAQKLLDEFHKNHQDDVVQAGPANNGPTSKVYENNLIIANAVTENRKQKLFVDGFVKGIVKKFSTPTVSASEPRQKIDITPESDGDLRYTVNVDGVEYKYYYQYGSSYSDHYFTHCGNAHTLASASCGYSSCANILTGYGNDVTPLDTCEAMGFNFNSDALLEDCCRHWEVEGKWEYASSEQDTYNKICEAISEGKPVIMLMNNGNGNFWTTGGHFIGVAGIDDSGNLVTLDPAASRDERRVCPQGLAFACETCTGFYIPDEAPDGKKNVDEFIGYEPDQAVVAPITGKIIEYGIEGGTGEHAPVKRKNVETGEEEEVEWIKIQATDNFMYHTKGDGTSYSEGRGYLNCTKVDDKTYDTFEDKAADSDKQHEGYDYFYEEYQNVCDGYVLYIEGFDLTAFDSDGSKALFDSGDNESADVTRYIKNEVYNMTDNLKEARAIWKEDAKAAADPYWQIGEDLYIKEGTVIGKTLEDPEIDETKLKTRTSIVTGEEEKSHPGNGNYIRLIFRDLEDAIVEDVESYIPVDDVVTSQLGDIEQFMYWQAKEPEGFEYVINGTQSYALAITGGKARSDNPSDAYGHNYYVDGAENNDINLCPGMYVGDYAPRQMFIDVTGKTPTDGNCNVFCTGEQLLDIYQQVLESEIQTLKTSFPALADLDDNDTRIFGLIDVQYAGVGNFEIGPMANKLRSGDLNLTLDDFLANATSENTFYSMNPEGLKRRRAMDYYIYAEGKYCCDLYDKKSDGAKMTERYEFFSDTPFQDLMRDTEGAERVSF